MRVVEIVDECMGNLFLILLSTCLLPLGIISRVITANLIAISKSTAIIPGFKNIPEQIYCVRIETSAGGVDCSTSFIV